MKNQEITGMIHTRAGKIPVVPTDLSRSDKWAGLKATWAVARDNYAVDPGLYAVGSPNGNSHVFVSANYKLSFDSLRQELKGLDAWMMVLDTRGINVWCAAGKGTFGTAEMVERIERTRLKEIVDHRNLIVPQLGATGVAAHQVRDLSGFSVNYGPVRASDIPAYLNAGMVATREMRRVRFHLSDRVRLIPMAVLQGLKYLIPAIGLLFVLAGLSGNGYSFALARAAGSRTAVNLLLAYLGGTAVGPALLPWLPGRSFSFKGFCAGMLMLVVSLLAGVTERLPVEVAAWTLMFAGISSFATMNFTGASTYTSLSGVRKEMRTAVPLEITAAAGGIVLWVVARFT